MVVRESGNRSFALTPAPRPFQEMKPGSWRPYASEPRPLPPPKDQLATFRIFCREELAGVCQNFSLDLLCREVVVGPIYRCRLGNITNFDITGITFELPKSVRKWIVEVKSMARLRHPHLCDVLGFYVYIPVPDSNPRPSSEQLVVYAGMQNGSLDQLLYDRNSDNPSLDWPSRLKIVFGAAQGLTFLQEISPVQVGNCSYQPVVEDKSEAGRPSWTTRRSLWSVQTATPQYPAEQVRVYAIEWKSGIETLPIATMSPEA